MKKILITITTLVAVSSLMSCNKEYTCQCDNYSVIVEAPNQGDAEATCSSKGPGCDVK